MSLIEDHFKLLRPPFPQTAETAAILQHASHKNALERLRFAIERGGIALLTVESGCGKTTLLGVLGRDLDTTKYLLVYSSLSTLGPYSLLTSLATKLSIRPKRTKGETAHELLSHLRGSARRAVLVIDEAHALPDASLEDLRLLTGDSLEHQSPFALILAGQPLLRERLSDPQHHSLNQRLTVRARLRPLTDTEVALFLDKHLRACGATRTIFEPDGITLIFQHSRGVPRMIQSLALNALMAAASSGKKTVDMDAVQQALLDQEAN